MLEQFPGALAVGIGQCRAFRPLLEAQMIQFAFTAGKSVDDFAQRLGLGQLAEHHGHELTPATEAFGSFLRAAFFHSPRESMPVCQQKQLAKKARVSYHRSTLR